MLPKALFAASLLSFVLLSALLQVTSPTTMHPAGILAVYALIYILALGLLTLFVYGIAKALHTIAPQVVNDITPLRSYYFASVLALLVVVMIAMMSIGRISAFEVVLVAVLGVIGCIYIARKH